MSSTYLSLTIDLPEADAEPLEALLHDLGALGLEVRDREAPPMPGVRGPAAGESIVVAFFGDEAAGTAALEAVRADFPRARPELAQVKNEDWSNSWKALIRPVQVGRLWVGPPWEVVNAPSGLTRVVIEPKMAFGTGDHPTTSLCLAALDAFMLEHPHASVLDVGTGTGVLAIAARKLGAARVVGTDNDAVSVTLARENAVDNGTPEVELSGKTLPGVEGVFDLVLANILANTLIELAADISVKVGRRLVLSGVLSHQAAEVQQAFVAQGLQALPLHTQGEWVALPFERRG